MGVAERTTLAIIEGFRRPLPSAPHGTHNSSYLICEAIARQCRYGALHIYREPHRRSLGQGEFVLPVTPPTTVHEKPWLHHTGEKYAAIYVANGEQMYCAPHVLRPKNDWAPVIASVGTTHANAQWSNLFLALASGAVRSTDGLIFKSSTADRLFREIGEDWAARFGFPSLGALGTTVIPNGVDVAFNQRSDAIRQQTRERFGIEADDIVYLSFSRLDPGTKGDFEALLVRWSEVVARVPRALLLLAGVLFDRPFVADLRQLARAMDVANRVLIVDNPFELDANARRSLMSASDVFLHLSTGIEEASALAVHEAMAHALPVIATCWAGMPEVVREGETGFLIETRSGPLVTQLAQTLFGELERTHLVHASRVVWCDWRAFVAACSELAVDTRRLALGAAARLHAEAHDIDAVARRYLAFFDATAASAEAAWRGPAPWNALVDLNQAVRAQATRQLEARARVRLGDERRRSIPTRGLYPESPAQVQALLAAFTSVPETSIGELAQAAAGFARAHHPTALGPEDDLAVSARLIIRLLNLGVLELV